MKRIFFISFFIGTSLFSANNEFLLLKTFNLPNVVGYKENVIKKKENKKTIIIKNKYIFNPSLYYKFNDYKLNKTNKKILMELIKLVKKQNKKIILVGHADYPGTKQQNVKIVNLRLKEAKKFLIDNGIPEKNIKTINKYNDYLINKKGKEKINRRVDIIIY